MAWSHRIPENSRTLVNMPRYWLLTSPRTASNMLVKILNLDEQNVRPAFGGGYFFMKTIGDRFRLLDKPMKDWTEEEKNTVIEKQQTAYDKFQEHLDNAEEEGQKIFVKEHSSFLNDPYFEAQYTLGEDSVAGLAPFGVKTKEGHSSRSELNKTSLPDEFLDQWSPTFLIRHPALMLPSLLRTCLKGVEASGFTRAEPLPVETSMKWIRTLYEYYAANFGPDSQWPIVLDCDDVIKYQDKIVSKYAALLDLDPAKLQYEWEPMAAEEFNAVDKNIQVMAGSIYRSNKVDLSKLAGDIDIAKEAIKWKEEFGEEQGTRVEGWVRAALPDYEYLRSKRLTV